MSKQKGKKLTIKEDINNTVEFKNIKDNALFCSEEGIFTRIYRKIPEVSIFKCGSKKKVNAISLNKGQMFGSFTPECQVRLIDAELSFDYIDSN